MVQDRIERREKRLGTRTLYRQELARRAYQERNILPPFPFDLYAHRVHSVDSRHLTGYAGRVIKNFRHRGLKRFFEADDARRLPRDMLDRISLILARLNTARTLEAMNVHSYHLHELKGDRKRTWSVTVRANWRITFQFEGEDAFDVNFEDYH